MFGRARQRERQPATFLILGPFAVIVVAATLVCIGLGFLLASRADDSDEAAQRQALRAAIEAMGPARAEQGMPAPEQLQFLEGVSGLRGLSADIEAVRGHRSNQSLIDGQGRIVGWLSWEPDRPATRLMTQLMPFLALTTIAVLLLSGVALWQMARLRRRLVRNTLSEQDERDRAAEDRLTGCPNQYRLRELLEKALAARTSSQVVSFAYLDLDRFGEVNHAHGALIGDDVLVEVANRLRASLPDGAAVGRVGGDCFGLVLVTRDIEASESAVRAACQAIARPVQLTDRVIQITASAGIASAPDHGTTRAQLAPHAELTLHAAKKRGRGSVVSFAADLEADLQEKHFIKRELGIALTEHALDLHYQPIVAADGSGIVGVEALLRWDHPVRGFIPPSVFVAAAEESGLMNRLGQFVLRRALADAASWPGIYLAVNLSPTQVRDQSFGDVVATLLAETQFDPARLVLEITEGVLIENPDETKDRLEELRALGVRIALDDFGSGYSSLSYLQRLPIDKLKIDRSFVLGLENSANGDVIIQAIVALGRALGMSVLVEGVETEKQRVLLRLAGCNEMQGFLFAHPAPRGQINQLMTAPRGASRLATMG